MDKKMTFPFEPLYFNDKIITVNPCGYTGIVTLWSQPNWVLEKLKEADIDVSSKTSPIAAVGNLYGNGLPELLRNLLYNPQISYIFIVGQDKSESARELKNYFIEGIEEKIFLGKKHYKIKGTSRLIDKMLNPSLFVNPPTIMEIGDLTQPGSMKKLKEEFKTLKPSPCPFEVERVNIPLQKIETERKPSNPRNHNIVEKDAITAWRELVYRIVRFGHLAHLRKGDRLELQNVRVVVEAPGFYSEQDMEKYNLDPEILENYYDDFFEPGLTPDISYTYGNRLSKYFGTDTIQAVIENFERDLENRQSFVSLWDTKRDLVAKTGHPCLVSLYFRRFDHTLTLTANFRTHNLLDAWLVNFYGLLKVQNRVCHALQIEKGPITVISDSISIDPRHLDRAKTIIEDRPFRVVMDPHGNFSIELEEGQIVLKQFFNGVQIDEYRGARASRIQHELNRKFAVSDINHAIYLGRMLERAEHCLKTGEEFTQE
ncbi:MAG: thymidylate synthase [Vulcanimicrobiota bacterium]